MVPERKLEKDEERIDQIVLVEVTQQLVVVTFGMQHSKYMCNTRSL